MKSDTSKSQPDFRLYPAIDLLNGKCVRLRQGDYAQVTEYTNDPTQLAREFAQAGGNCLHVVDLSGARDPKARDLKTIGAIVAAVDLKIQVGGGIRSREEVAELFASGVDRVILGSLVAKDPGLAKALLTEFGGERIVFGLDVALDSTGLPLLAIHGWQETTKISLWQVLREFSPLGLKHILVTDIARDGMLAGPALALYAEILQKFPEISLLASGGISNLEDIRALRKIGAFGAITGKALLEGRFTLSEALQC